MLRNLCQNGLDWDDPVPDEKAIRWKKWRESLALFERVRYPRSFKPTRNIRSTQMHVFADASSYTSGCACYLHVEGPDDEVYCVIVAAKSRLAEPGVNTIPRLEVEAAVDAVKLAEMAKKELEWADCPCVY